MPTMRLPDPVYATIAAVVAQFPHTGDDDARRQATRKIVSQLRFLYGQRWVCKSEHPNGWASSSKDAIGYLTEGGIEDGTTERRLMYIWDLINGTTRELAPNHESETVRAAYALAPPAVDWLANGSAPLPPAPEPEPAPEPAPAPAPELAAIAERLAHIEAAIVTLMANAGPYLTALDTLVAHLQQQIAHLNATAEAMRLLEWHGSIRVLGIPAPFVLKPKLPAETPDA